jgi:predicted kinase
MTLIVVSGSPGTGKSTVAAALGTELSWPVLSLDPLKETLADQLGLGDQDWSSRLGDAAAAIIFRLAREFPDAIAEGWWRGDRRDRARSVFTGAAEVFCHCPPDLADHRMRSRIGTGRHPIHRDVINPAMLNRARELATTVVPLNLGGPLIDADTSQPDAPDAAVAAVREALGVERPS